MRCCFDAAPILFMRKVRLRQVQARKNGIIEVNCFDYRIIREGRQPTLREHAPTQSLSDCVTVAPQLFELSPLPSALNVKICLKKRIPFAVVGIPNVGGGAGVRRAPTTESVISKLYANTL